MEFIHHERQEGSLCAMHCINAMLQGSYYSAVDLAELANKMDSEEQLRMAEHGTNTTEYREFIRGGSNNMDDSGMFSIQVVSSALEVWGLSLTPFTSLTTPSASLAREDPTCGNAYICNMREHWFTIRKLGLQWFNLNSLLAFPELLSNTYLALFLAQLQSQGYSIYLVEGNLPPSEADEALTARPATQTVKPPLLSELTDQQQGGSGGESDGADSQSREDADLAAALAASLADTSLPGISASASHPTPAANDSERGELERALQLSLTEHRTTVPNSASDQVSPQASTPNEEVLRQKRLQFFDKKTTDES